MEIINKVADSGIITINLEDYLPQEPILVFDIKDYLFRGLILKEKDFREALKQIDWTAYKGQFVTITCSTDAIVANWAYMLVVAYLQPFAKEILIGNVEEAREALLRKNINNIAANQYENQRIVIKGCGDQEMQAFAYAEITKVLLPHVKSLMYGEPCSTVPVYKKKSI